MPLNTREEQEFKKLHLNLNKRMPRLWLSITVERNGIILEDRREEGHSWTRNAWWLMNGVMLDCVSDGGTEAYNRFGVTTSGSVTASSYPPVRDISFAGDGYYNSGANNSFGIQVGTGTSAFHAYRYELEDLVAHGNDADQLYYQAQSAPVTSYDSITGKHTQTITRIFNNNSGDAIEVANAGLVWQGGIFYQLDTGKYLLSYDLLDLPVNVPGGAQLTVTYEIETAVPDWATDFPLPELGDAAAGGTLVHLSFKNYTLMIVAPKSGGESTAINWSDPSFDSGYPTSSTDGAANTAALEAHADSEIGAFSAAANAASLGGYDDWFIPAKDQFNTLYTTKANLPVGEEYEEETYWSSTASTSMMAYYTRMSTGYASSAYQDYDYRIRLMRLLTFQEYWDSL